MMEMRRMMSMVRGKGVGTVASFNVCSVAIVRSEALMIWRREGRLRSSAWPMTDYHYLNLRMTVYTGEKLRTRWFQEVYVTVTNSKDKVTMQMC